MNCLADDRAGMSGFTSAAKNASVARCRLAAAEPLSAALRFLRSVLLC